MDIFHLQDNFHHRSENRNLLFTINKITAGLEEKFMSTHVKSTFFMEYIPFKRLGNNSGVNKDQRAMQATNIRL